MNQSQFDRFVERVCSVTVTDPRTSFVNLGVDSLNTINLVLAVEEEYGVEIDPEALAGEALATPAGLWDYVRAHLPAGAGV